MPAAIVPVGFVRHSISGCIIPSAEVPMHEAALAIKAAHRTLAPKSADIVAAENVAATQAALAESQAVAREAVDTVAALRAELDALKAGK